MKIGVIADTHSREIPPQVFRDLKNVELVIHAGDFCCREDFDKFSKFKRFVAVAGNMDEVKLVKKLPRQCILDCDGIRIGIYHGDGSTQKILDSVNREFKGKTLDVIVFGHTHIPMNQVINKTLYFNPGSPNDLVISPYASYGILEINKGKVTGEIVKIKS